MCNQSRGQGAYGSSQGFQPQQMRQPQTYTPNTQNKTLNQGMQYGMQRLQRMPSFLPGSPGQFGMAGSMGAQTSPAGTPMQNIPIPLPPNPWKGPDFEVWGDDIRIPPNEQTAGGMPMNIAQAQQGSIKPAPYFAQDPVPSAAYVGQAMSPPAQSNPLQAQNLTQMANQAVMGPFGNMYNRPGDPRGGYFQNGQYTPHVGNAMTGLDNLARWGLGPDGQPLNRGPFLR